MFPLWLAIVIIFYFLSGCWLWKLINIFYYCQKKKKKKAQLESQAGKERKGQNISLEK